eukprot:4324098-Prymnesium_polylepis.1
MSSRLSLVPVEPEAVRDQLVHLRRLPPLCGDKQPVAGAPDGALRPLPHQMDRRHAPHPALGDAADGVLRRRLRGRRRGRDHAERHKVRRGRDGHPHRERAARAPHGAVAARRRQHLVDGGLQPHADVAACAARLAHLDDGCAARKRRADGRDVAERGGDGALAGGLRGGLRDGERAVATEARPAGATRVARRSRGVSIEAQGARVRHWQVGEAGELRRD